ncbi:MAG: RDD family protein [Acidobacteria bacterium]|nr:RDD family protein [Acidobacteriota bacterium]
MKNGGVGVSCFVCGKVLPSGGGAAAERPAARSSPSGKKAETTVVPGPVGDRALALLFDRVLLFAVIAFTFGLYVREAALTFYQPGTGATIGLFFGWFLLIFAYHTLLEGLAGTTPGKLVMGLRVVSTGERRMIGAVALRNLLRLVDGIALYFVGFVVAAHNRSQKRVGDFVGGTMVIQVPMQPMERGAALITLIVIIAAAIWGGGVFCPGCSEAVGREIASTLNALTTVP